MKIAQPKFAKNYTGDKSCATMLLYGLIGVDEKGNGIDGNEFANEMFMLQDMGCEEIKVRINSAGGSVFDGFSIFSAIDQIKKKIPVNIYIDGVAASIAGVIAMAGTKVCIADFGMLMIHDPSFGGEQAETAKDREILSLMKDSLCKMLAGKNNFQEKNISDMMSAETWMSADTAKSYGFADEVFSTNNPKVSPTLTRDAKNLMKFYNNILINNNSMKRINELLGLRNEASESATEEAITKLKSDLITANENLAKAELAKKELEAKLAASELEKKTAEEAVAKEVVAQAVTENKIENKADVIASWETLAKTDLNAVKNAFSAMGKKTSATKITDAIRKESTQAGTIATDRKDWTARDWEKKDSKGWQNLKDTNFASYKEIYEKTYKTTLAD